MKKIFTFLLTFIAGILFLNYANAACNQESIISVDSQRKLNGSYRNICTYSSNRSDNMQIVIYQGNIYTGETKNSNEIYIVGVTGIDTGSPTHIPLLCFDGSEDGSKYFLPNDNNGQQKSVYINGNVYSSSGSSINVSDDIKGLHDNLYSGKCDYKYAGIYTSVDVGLNTTEYLAISNNKNPIDGDSQFYGEITDRGPDYIGANYNDAEFQLSGNNKYYFSKYSVKKERQKETEVENKTCEVYEKNLCNSTGVLKGLMTSRKIIDMIKICVPLILIVIGSITLVSAVISSDSDSISKAGKNLLGKTITGLIVFLVPTIIIATVNIFTDYDKEDSRFTKCKVCFFNSNYEDECLRQIKIIEDKNCQNLSECNKIIDDIKNENCTPSSTNDKCILLYNNYDKLYCSDLTSDDVDITVGN